MPKETRQALVYEIKKSASGNSAALFSSDGKKFYWNGKSFKKLTLGDVVFVVNPHDRWVVFGTLSKNDVKSTVLQDGSTTIEDEGEKFPISGKWTEDFVRLDVTERVDVPADWQWKSFGSSETTYLSGPHIDKGNANRAVNIAQLSEAFNGNSQIGGFLNDCAANFDTRSVVQLIREFTLQARAQNLKSSAYSTQYRGFKVKASFGMGGAAKVPWMAFYGGRNNTHKGIYVCYLYYKSSDRLVLSLGTSETETAETEWPDTVKNAFPEIGKNLPDGERYLDSLEFRSYRSPISGEIEEKDTQILKDLDDALDIYHDCLEKQGRQIQYWLYSPGTNGGMWDEFHEEGVAAIPWEEMGDLSTFKDKPSIELRYSEAYGKAGTNDVLACHEFANEMREGDVVIPKRGNKTLLGYGIVEGGYYFDANAGSYKSRRKVNWKKSGEWFQDEGDLVAKTLTNITQYADYVDKLVKLIGIGAETTEREITTKVTGEMKIGLNTILYGAPGTGKTFHTVNYAVSAIENKALSEIEGEERTEVLKRYNGYKREGKVVFTTFHQSYGYEEFIGGIRAETDGDGNVRYEVVPGIFKEICDRAEARMSSGENFVIVIDEINRGNVSKVFGELITLVETTKRVGNPEETRATLPNFKGEAANFGVPNNLYVIGTMNTADRSIALMDIALRRRFEFVEMPPDSKLLEGIVIDGIDVKKMFEAMNARIEYLFDKDHALGHSMFLGLRREPTLTNLAKIFRNSIIPLLEEYFHEDWSRIQLVLGDHPDQRFKSNGDKLVKDEVRIPDSVFGCAPEDLDDKVAYALNPAPSVRSFVGIYDSAI